MNNAKPQELNSRNNSPNQQARYRCKDCQGTGQVMGVKKITGMGKGMGSTFGMCPNCDGVGWIESTSRQGMSDQFVVLEGFYRDILCKMFEYNFAGRNELIAQMKYTTMLSDPDKDGHDIVEFSVAAGPRANTELRLPVELHAHDKDNVAIFVLLFVDDGKLHLLDMYKADGSKILELPSPKNFTRTVWEERDGGNLTMVEDHVLN